MSELYDFTIQDLGACTIPTPIRLSKIKDYFIAHYEEDDHRVIHNVDVIGKDSEFTLKYKKENLLEIAGPRENIFFDPTQLNAGIVTCGGLCPGINDVIRAIVMCLWHHYGVRRISGFRYGYRGLIAKHKIRVEDLTPEKVSRVHGIGGSILGTSRGSGDTSAEIVDTLERLNIGVLFAIGGDGTQKGALAITQEIEKRGLKIAVVGIPKTIDNDLSFVQKSFGFETAVSKAVEAVAAAHTEAHDAWNGVGLVRVMGRHSGFIAAHTALAMNDANFVLVPEIPFDIHGENGLLAHLEKRILERHHALILVAEGAAQDILEKTGMKDLSGNTTLADIGVFLKLKIQEHFKARGIEVYPKYIDPSYIIRSQPANPNDSIYCARLGNNAVHAAMAGKTSVMISLINDKYVHVPLKLVVSKTHRLDPESSLWRDVLSLTGQPLLMKN